MAFEDVERSVPSASVLTASHPAGPHIKARQVRQLTKYQSHALREFTELNQRIEEHADNFQEVHAAGHGHGNGHGHEEKPLSIVSASISAVINFLLMFGLCCAYGMIMFGDKWNDVHKALGVKMNLATAMITGISLATFSKVNVAIGGPDLNPVVFLGMFAQTLATEIAEQHGLKIPSDDRRLGAACGSEDEHAFLSWYWLDGDASRRLGGSCKSGGDEVQFCIGSHYAAHTKECNAYHEELRATTIFAVSVSSALLMVIFLGLGKFKLTRYVSYMPTSIMEAFLSCVGYKVFKYALEFCLYDTRQFIPAACVGVVLYFLKAMHIGNPALVIPAMLLIPLGIFYVVIFLSYGSDSDQSFIDKARKDCLFFPKMEEVAFFKIWEDSIGNYSAINFKAWTKTISDLVIMLIVCLLDCLLKLSSTESKLPVKTDKDYEIQLYGACNLVNSLCGASVGYMQLKFNVINYGILNNVKDRRAGILYGMLCGVCFFWTIELFNYLPRFFLGVLLFFAGAGFVAENLWGSRKYLSLQEWCQILAIIGVFIIFNSLLYAVIVGGLITGVAFIIRYARVPCIAGRPLRGGEIITCQRYDPFVQSAVTHICNSWLLVLRLKGFIFFASAQTMTKYVTKQLENQKDLEPYRRLRFIMFDCELLDGMDASASKAIQKCARQAESFNVRVLWSSIGNLYADLKMHGTLTEDQDNDVFKNLPEAMLYVESLAIKRMQSIQQRWCSLDQSFRYYHDVSRIRMQFEPFGFILPLDSGRLGCPWDYCGRMAIQKNKTVLFKPKDLGKDLYLIHTGKVGIFDSIPSAGAAWSTPVAIFERGSFLNISALVHAPSRHYAIALEDGELLFWNEHQWWRMTRERPYMASAIMKKALTQEHLYESKLEHMMETSGGGVPEDDAESFQDHEVEEDSTLPESLQYHLGGVIVAHAFDKFGLFDALADTDDDVLPRLPSAVERELQVAFHTYCNSDEVSGKDLLSPHHLNQALMYAGIFGTIFNANELQALTQTDFIEFAREAFFLRLSTSMCEKVSKLFRKFDATESGALDLETISAALKSIFHSNITVEAVMGAATLWSSNINTEDAMLLDREAFLGFISRLMRKSEHDWYIMQAFNKLIGHTVLKNHGINDSEFSVTGHDFTAAVESYMMKAQSSFQAFTSMDEDRLSVDVVLNALRANGQDVPVKDVEEMLWAANSYGDGGENYKKLDFRLVIPVLLTVYEDSFPLPPVPRKPPRVTDEALNIVVTEMRGSQWFRPGTQLHTSNFGSAPRVINLDDSSCSTAPKAKGYRDQIRDLRSETFSLGRLRVGITETNNGAEDEGTKNKGKDPKAMLEASASYQSYLDAKNEVRIIPSTIRAKIYLLLEEPDSSQAANILSTVMGVLILASVLTLVAEPLISPKDEKVSDGEKQVWEMFEIFFTVLFTLEFFLRWAVATALHDGQTCMNFVREPMNICDIVAVLPFYIEKTIDTESAEFRLFRVIRLTRLARVIRIGRLSKRSQLFAPIAMVLTVIWGIYLKTGMKE